MGNGLLDIALVLPVSESESLPSRDEWLLHLSMILGDLEQGIGPEIGQGNLFADTSRSSLLLICGPMWIC